MGAGRESRERFIDAAVDAFRRNGYHGVGVQGLVEASGAPRGSFYHHFPGGKEELAALAVERAGRFVSGEIDAAFDAARDAGGATDPATALAHLSRRLGELLARSDWREGCPLAAIASDSLEALPALEATVRETLERWQRRLSGQLAAAGLAAAAADALAEEVLVLLEGAWMVARVRRSTAPFDTASAVLRARLEAVPG